MRNLLIVGNWKMNGSAVEISEFDQLRVELEALSGHGPELLVCAPATLIPVLADTAESILVGGQDCHPEVGGAHTGDISAELLADAGANAVIVGHSERRTAYGESDELVKAKAMAAHRAGLTAIVCVGEKAEDRDTGRALDVVLKQVRGSLPPDAGPYDTVVAYEPIWAIGSGRTPKSEEIREVHQAIHKELQGRTCAGARVLYGGSVSPDNCVEILQIEGVDGALVGGASLRCQTFLPIIVAAK